jgi:hypothetical protein
MPQSEARAWWADVEHLREGLEGRRPASASEVETPVSQPAAARAPRARRTVQITGRPAAAPARAPRRLVEVERRRPAARPIDRIGHRPDRLALWAAVLGFALVLVAAMSAHA